ncbi:MAG: ECF transporter S component [Oscillospiraceae bacterium]|nr:ECF transporter S component [Oscillospiraceae bacterium]
MENANRRTDVQKMAVLSILIALIIALQVFSTFIKFGPYNITLALTPVIIGGALYGLGAGTLLGGVFGLVILLIGILGWDGGGTMALIQMRPVACIGIILLRGLCAGFLSALVFRQLSKKSIHAGSLGASIVCPVVNTAIFVIGMVLCFGDILAPGAQEKGQSILVYTIMALAGINFVIELIVNVALASGITTFLRYRMGRKE